MKLLNFSFVFFQLLIFTLLHGWALATKKTYIVCLGSHSHDVEPKFVDVDQVKSSHHEFLGSFLGSKVKSKRRIHYSYAMHVNAFAAVLEEDEAFNLAKHPDVISVLESKGGIKPLTTRSWEFLGLERNNGEVPRDTIWERARFGEDVIIANLDVGIWPESKSFNDEGMGPVPSRWRGICQIKTKNGTRGCNRKLIGARYFNQGYLANCSLTPGCKPKSYYNTAIDYHGHGTHTLATAGGSFVPGANVFGQAYGTAKGGAPRARVAAYKICGAIEVDDICDDSDILAGLDAAIADGVDVISLSIGIGIQAAKDLSQDLMAIGAFHAVKRGIVVVAAGGNEGPEPETITNVAPWMITVGASTIDRRFTSYIVLGNRKIIVGVGLSSAFLVKKSFYPLITGIDAKAINASAEEADNCLPGALDPQKVEGKILVCHGNEFADEMELIGQGVAGMIIMKETTRIGKGVEYHFLPTSVICQYDGEALNAYLKSTKNPLGYIIYTKTELGIKPSPVVLSMSSRGPNPFYPTLLKPDIVAPGENILAATSEADNPSELGGGPFRGIPFKLWTGTSMACPHIAGIAGLLKAINPTWSPAAIQSALMTTAETQQRDMKPLQAVNTTNLIPATPFAYGAGHVNPNKAMDPGLVYDLSVKDYLNFLCALGYNETTMKLFFHKPFKCRKSFKLEDFNYPSITVPELGDSMTVTRTLKNVASPGTYKVAVKAPTGISVSIKPSKLTFTELGQKKKYKIILKPKDNENRPTDYVFGKLIWSDGEHNVYSPLVVRLKI